MGLLSKMGYPKSGPGVREKTLGSEIPFNCIIAGCPCVLILATYILPSSEATCIVMYALVYITASPEAINSVMQTF